jgi:leukotriene-A4 hydrolase
VSFFFESHIPIFCLFVLVSCETPQPYAPMTLLPTDVHSYAQPNVARVTHLHWKAQVNFENKTIQATATWNIRSEEAREIILDTKGLSIHEVRTNGSKADFSRGPVDVILGQSLTIPIGDDTKTISIQYTTSPEAEALQWLTPEQTAGKNTPFCLLNPKPYWRAVGCRVKIRQVFALRTRQW